MHVGKGVSEAANQRVNVFLILPRGVEFYSVASGARFWGSVLASVTLGNLSNFSGPHLHLL